MSPIRFRGPRFFKPNVEKMEAKRDVEGLIQALGHEDHGIRVNAALALGKLKNAGAVKALVDALRDPNEDVRWAAAWALGEIGKPAVRPLVQALKDEEGEVRWKAAWALEKMGRQVLDSLLDAFATEEGEAKSKIAMVLGSIGDVRAVRPLVQALGDEDESVRWGARWALQKLGGAVVRSLVKTLEEDEDPRARMDAAVALGVIGDSSAVPTLVSALSDESEGVREAAERALVEIGDKKAVSSLEGLLKHHDEKVREHAQRALAGLGWAPLEKEERIEFLLKHGQWGKVLEQGEGVVPLVVRELSGRGGEDRKEVARLISARGHRVKAKVMELLSDVDEAVRREASYLAREIADESLLPYLADALASTDPVVRRNTALALARVRTPEAVEMLVRAMGDEDEEVGRAASWALGQLGELSAGRLMEALGSPEARVRRGAAWALGVVKDDRAVEALVRALKDPDEKVRKGAAWALGEMGPQAAAALSRSLEDPEVREAVKEILEKIGWEEKGEIPVAPAEEEEGPIEEIPPVPIVEKTEEIVTEILDKMGIGEETREGKAEVLIERQDWDGLLEMGEEAVPALEDALMDPDPQVRAKAAWCLGVIGSERSVEPLVKALGDPSRDVRLGAAGALKKMGSSAVEPLIRALREGDDELRKEAARVLGDIGDERAAGSLVEALTDRDERVRGRVVASLVKLGEPAVAVLQEAARSVSDEMRRMANLVLVKMGRKRPEEVEAVAELPEGEKASEADIVANLIERGEWEQVATLGSVAFPALIAALRHEDPDRRKGAAWALGVMRDDRAVEYLVRVLEEDEPQVRRAAAWALGVIGDSRGVPALIRALQDDDPEVRRKAAWALGEIGDERARDALVQALQDPDTDVRRVSSLVLERMGWEPTEMVSEIRAMIASRKWDSLAGMGEVAVQALIEALDDDDPETREKAAWALGEIGDVRAVEPLIGKLEDEAVPVRVKAAWALGKIGDERAKLPLSRALQDEDEEVRVQVAAVMTSLGWEAIPAEEAPEVIPAPEEPIPAEVAPKAGPLEVPAGEAGAPAMEAGELSEIPVAPEETPVPEEATAVEEAPVVIPAPEEPIPAEVAPKAGPLEVPAGEAVTGTGMFDPGEVATLLRDGRWREIVEAGPASVTALLELVKRGGAEGRKASVVLSKMGEDAVGGLLEAYERGAGKEVVEPILQSLGWKSLEDEAYARSLVERGKWEEAAKLGSPAVRPLVEMLESQDPGKRERAAYLLGLIGSSRSSSPLLKLLRDDPEPSVRKRAAWSLGRLKDRGSLQALVEALRDESDQVRRAAAQALERRGWIPGSNMERALFLLATHQWGALVALGGEALEVMRERIGDSDLEVQENLAWVLERLEGSGEG